MPLTSDPRNYPLLGRASILACPVHDLVVALNEDGRIASTCPECIREARTARRRLPSINRKRALRKV